MAFSHTEILKIIWDLPKTQAMQGKIAKRDFAEPVLCYRMLPAMNSHPATENTHSPVSGIINAQNM